MEIRIDSAADQSILNALRQGQRRQAGQLLVRYYGNMVFNVCRTLVPTLEQAEDLTQASFTRAFTDLGGIQGSPSARVWLMNVAQRCCADHLAELGEAADELPQAVSDSSSGYRISESLQRRLEMLATSL